MKGREKHGLNSAVAAGFKQEGVGLVVTVDCGITNRDAVAELAAEGIDVVVTDHHELIDTIPDSVANVDPKRPDSKYPYRGLAGVGVALKLAMGLVSEAMGLSIPEFFSIQSEAVGLAVLGTLADRVPLTGENRTLVSTGMDKLERTRLPLVRLMLDRIRQEGKIVPARMVAELLPLFASAEGSEGVCGILTQDEGYARKWLDELELRAARWRDEAQRSLDLAGQQAQVGDGVVIVHSRELGLRTLGFCATKLRDRYGMPAIILGWRGDAWVGECRGVEGLSLLDLLRHCSGHFIDYGGHKMAAGFTILDERVEQFARDAEAYAHEHFSGRLPVEQAVTADAVLPVAEFDSGLRVLAPFGEGNPAPVFVSEPVSVEESSAGWVCSTRRDLVMRPAQRGVPGDEPVVLLYTMDDYGRLTALDFRSSHA